MNYLFLSLLFIPFAFVRPSTIADEQGADLTLIFQNINTDKGTLRLALYNSKSSFLEESQAKLYNFPVVGDTSQTNTLPGLKPGVYAMAVFLDENDNFKLDKNLIGIPVELYCFSKKPPSKWKPPTFDEAKFTKTLTSDTLLLYLQRWRL